MGKRERERENSEVREVSLGCSVYFQRHSLHQLEQGSVYGGKVPQENTVLAGRVTCRARGSYSPWVPACLLAATWPTRPGRLTKAEEQDPPVC